MLMSARPYAQNDNIAGVDEVDEAIGGVYVLLIARRNESLQGNNIRLLFCLILVSVMWKSNSQKHLVIFKNWLIGYRSAYWSVLPPASIQTCLVCTNRWKHEKQLQMCINISKQSKTLIPLFPFHARPWDLKRFFSNVFQCLKIMKKHVSSSRLNESVHRQLAVSIMSESRLF